MKQGTIFRILILALGLYVLCGSITGISTSLWTLRDYRTLDPLTKDYQLSILIGYGLFPFIVALVMLMFSQKIERFFLGGQADILISGAAFDSGALIKIVIRLIGLYLLCTYGSAMAATIYEMIAVRSGNQQFTEEQVTADIIANGVGLGLASALCFRTTSVLEFISEKKK